MSDYTGVTNQLGNVVGLPFSSFSVEEPGMIDLAFAADDLTRMNDMFWLDGIRQDSADWTNGDGAVRWSNGFNVYVRPFRAHINGTMVFAPQIALTIDQEPVSSRVDSIIIRRNYNLRTVDVMILKGTSGNANPPALTYNAFGIAEYALAHIRVTNGMASLAQSDVVDVRTRLTANLGVSPWFRGKIDLLPVRHSDLSLYAPGWYFCNGDLYPLSSVQGGALFDLPANLKNDWSITVSGNNISLPNMFYSDGRGYYLRAVNGTTRQVGSIQNHATAQFGGNIYSVVSPGDGTNITTDGIFSNSGWQRGANFYQSPGGGVFNISIWIGDATESRSINRGMIPAIFLGV